MDEEKCGEYGPHVMPDSRTLWAIWSDDIPFMGVWADTREAALEWLANGMKDTRFRELTSHESFHCKLFTVELLYEYTRTNTEYFVDGGFTILGDCSF